MTYPNSINVYPNRIDKNASGWYISGEYFNVPSSTPYQMYLDHVPKDSATTEIWASGGAEWTEDITGTPAAGEFYVEYDVGRVTFNVANADAALEGRYYTLGDDIMGEHVNNMQDEVVGVETELGYPLKDIYTNLSQRLDQFMTLGSTVNAYQVNMVTPVGISSTTLQEFTDLAGTTTRADTNPFGIGWADIYNVDGDMVRAQNNITTRYLYASTISASGNQIGLNIDGPDADSWIYFYDNSVPDGQHIKWDNGDSRFELSEAVFIQGNITASGNIMPEASGTRDVGSATTTFNEGHFNTLYGDGSNLVNTPAGYAHTQGGASIGWTIDHNLGSANVIVQVMDDSLPPLQIIPTEIEYTTNDRVTITFAGSQAGKAMVLRVV